MPSRKQAWIALALALAAVTLWAVLAPDAAQPTAEPQGRAGAPLAPAPTAPGSAERPAPLSAERAFLGAGGTLASTLERLGLPDRTRHGVLRSVAGFVDLRRLPRQTGVCVGRDDRGRVRRVSLRTAVDRFLRVDLGHAPGDPAGVEWVELPIETDVETVAGSIESSVAQALSETTFGTQLTLAYADILQWDVDLLVDPRPGDRVGLVYEVHRLGPLPDDLPPFGNAEQRPGQLLGPGRILAVSYDGAVASARGFWVRESDESGNYYDAQGHPLRKSFLKSPLNYRRISSGFSRARTHPVTRKVVPHHGVDFAADPGTPVVATADGQVASAGWDGALGKAVRIRHGSEYVTVYGHFRAIAKGVRRGVSVRQNEVIGYVGSTGRATGPHLHYTVIQRGRAINPLRMENPPVKPLDPAHRPRLDEALQRWAAVLDALAPRPDGVRLAERDGPVDPWLGAGSGS